MPFRTECTIYDNLKRRRLDLLWRGVQSADDQEGYVELIANTAREAGYLDFFGEAQFMDVFEFDVQQLLNADGAIEVDADHKMHGIGGFVAYRLTLEGQRMLFDAGYPIDSQR